MPRLDRKPDGRYFIDDNIGGRRIRAGLSNLVDGKKVPVRDAAVAEAMFHEYVKNRRHVDELSDEPDPFLRDLFDWYLEEYKPARGHSAATITKATQVLHDFRSFCSTVHVGRVSQLAPRTIDKYINHMRKAGRQGQTIVSHLNHVRAALTAAKESKYIVASPIEKWLMPAVEEHEIDPLDIWQLRKVLQVIGSEAPAIFPIVFWIASTGNRPSDAASLHGRNIDFFRSYVERLSVKVKALREYPVSPAALAIAEKELKKWGDPRGLVFRNRNDNPFAGTKLLETFKGALKRGGFTERPVTLKDLRHTFGSIMANGLQLEGKWLLMPCPIPTLRVMLGHRRVEQTMKYVRAGEGRVYLNQHAALLTEPLKKPENVSPLVTGDLGKLVI